MRGSVVPATRRLAPHKLVIWLDRLVSPGGVRLPLGSSQVLRACSAILPRLRTVRPRSERAADIEDDRDTKAQEPGRPGPSERIRTIGCAGGEGLAVCALDRRVPFPAASRAVRRAVCLVSVGDRGYASGFSGPRHALPVERSLFHRFPRPAGLAAGVDAQPSGAVVLLGLAGRDCGRRGGVASSCFDHRTDAMRWAVRGLAGRGWFPACFS